MTPEADESKLDAQRKYQAIREKIGRKPSASEFYRESNISPRKLESIYGGKAFGKLVVECGDQPEEFVKPKSELRKILETWGKLARELQTPPVGAEWSQRRLAPTVDGIRKIHGIKWPLMANEFLREFGSDAEWQDVVALIPRTTTDVAVARSRPDSVPHFVSQFLPPIVADLAVLSESEETANDFEKKVSLVFQLLSFEVTPMGQGTGRNPDAIAKAPQEHFVLLIDAKARNESYVMGTEDRKFIEYIRHHQPTLVREGYRKIYFVIVSSRFSGRDASSITRVKQETQIPVVEIRADQLLRLLAFKVENPLQFDRSKFEKLLLSEGELADNAITKTFK
ncbi:MAG: hypothetical protein NTV51_11800 [Verrucomicrobia bacterium]|nr:hypothetical protein [Verrucomicrobiota bacterium]